MKGNQGLDALAALCGGTFGSNLADDSKLLEGTTAERSGMLGPTSAGANGDATLRYPSSNTAMSDVMTPQQWQQYFLASGCGGGSAPTSGTDPSAAAVAALFTAASCKQSRDGRAPQFNQAASLFQQLALNYQGQYATMYNAHAATQFAQQHSQQPHLAPSLTVPVSKQQHISQEQQVRPTSEASRDSHPHINAPRPVPQHVNSVGRDIRVAGGATHKLAHKKQLRARTAKSATTGQQERESYVADESGAISAALAGASSSSATTEKKELKRAANRRSAQLSRKRKKHFIEELKDENDELKRKERILRSIPDLIVVFDSAGRLGFVSDSVSNFLDCSPSDLEGTSFWHRLCDESVKLLKAAFMDALAARRAGVDTSPLGDGLWVLRLKSTNGSQKLVILNGVVHFSGEKPECVCSIRPKYNHKTSVKNTCGGENVILRHMDTASEGEDTDTAEANIKPQQSVVSGSSDDSLLAVIGKRHKVPNVSLRNRSRVAAQISDGESLSEAGSDYR